MSERIPARIWDDTWCPTIIGWSKSGYPEYEKRLDVAMKLYPYVNIWRGLKGLESSGMSNLLIDRIIDMEEVWGFTRDDWFVHNNYLFLTDDGIATMFKLHQT